MSIYIEYKLLNLTSWILVLTFYRYLPYPSIHICMYPNPVALQLTGGAVCSSVRTRVKKKSKKLRFRLDIQTSIRQNRCIEQLKIGPRRSLTALCVR